MLMKRLETSSCMVHGTTIVACGILYDGSGAHCMGVVS